MKWRAEGPGAGDGEWALTLGHTTVFIIRLLNMYFATDTLH